MLITPSNSVYAHLHSLSAFSAFSPSIGLVETLFETGSQGTTLAMQGLGPGGTTFAATFAK